MSRVKVEVEINPENKAYCSLTCRFLNKVPFLRECILFSAVLEKESNADVDIRRCYQCKMAEKYNEVKDETKS